MTSLNKMPYWAWLCGVVIFGIVPVMMLLTTGAFAGAFLTIMSILYAVGLGRAAYRQNLLARGVQLDD
ncbi:hypothetical protein ACFQO7_32205 [Catellatospora aurea]|uniref:Uncharacterized protein n=1 Tax=Catellatospora aurea TaxID=1337874 RepID=A0ABW2H8Z1_9ACTN